MKTTIKRDVLLKDFTTIKVGGVAKYYAETDDQTELKKVISFAKKNDLNIFILGGGSDIVISKKGFDGLVLKFLGKKIEFATKKNNVLVTAEAGMIWDDLVKTCVDKNLQGIECLSGIPGTVGAAPIQNIGAYGQEIKNTFLELTAYDMKEGRFVSFSNKDCKFSYRESIFKSKSNWQRYIIVNVMLSLVNDGQPTLAYDSLKNYFIENKVKNPSLKQVRDAVLNIRKLKFENYKDSPNAGSFFKNPVLTQIKINKLQKIHPEIPCFKNNDGTYKCFAGWFIEKAGWKGKKLGNAQVSPKHALILLNPEGKATAEDILKLSENIKKDVINMFGVKLEREVQLIGF